MRALIVTNMYPSQADPVRGRFVADQVEALEQREDVSVSVYAFVSAGGGMSAYVRAAQEARRRYRGERFDIVHAHFGLSAWPALAVRGRARVVTLHGSDLALPRTRQVTLTALPWLDLTACVSTDLVGRVPRWAVRGRVAVLPCGVSLDRFKPTGQAAAREALGLSVDGHYLLFAADPARPEKRFDRARAVAGGEYELLTLGSVAPERVPLFINASDAVLVTSEREGFGLAVLEALACGVPVLATPHGVAPAALDGVEGCLCAEFEAGSWRAVVDAAVARSRGTGDWSEAEDADVRAVRRERAARWSSVAMADRVVEAWRALL
jgi:teichuronic acid biosynthesis glycosyltransferase TuaC